MNTILVGHCHYDGPRLEKITTSLGHKTTRVDTIKEAISLLKTNPNSLILLNRIIDTTGEESIPQIKSLKKEFPLAKILLVSNYEDAQKQAEENGAIKGFGKEMSDKEIAKHLTNILQ